MEPLFVIGHPKSGTSLLNSLLDNHSKLLVLSEESDFYQAIWQKASMLNYAWRKSKEEKIDELFVYIVDKTHFRNYLRGKVDKDISGNLDYEHLDTAKFKKLIKENLNYSIENGKFKRYLVISSLLKSFQELINSEKGVYSYWVEKTPKHTWYLNHILSDWPRASFIFVFRDPRDNYVSYKKKLGDSLTIPIFCKSWNDAIERYNKLPSHVHKIQVCYEQLIKNQRVEIERIASFLRIDIEPSLYSPTKLGRVWKGNSMFNLASEGMHDQSIGRFQNALIIEEIASIEYLTNKNMRSFGYQLKTNGKGLDSSKNSLLDLEYDACIPFNIDKPLTWRSRLGLLRRRILG